MIDHCTHLSELLEEEMRRILDDPDFRSFKWYRSEEEHHDIGVREALRKFSETEYWQNFCEEFRQTYCGSECKDRNNCEIGIRYANSLNEEAV